MAVGLTNCLFAIGTSDLGCSQPAKSSIRQVYEPPYCFQRIANHLAPHISLKRYEKCTNLKFGREEIRVVLRCKQNREAESLQLVHRWHSQQTHSIFTERPGNNTALYKCCQSYRPANNQKRIQNMSGTRLQKTQSKVADYEDFNKFDDLEQAPVSELYRRNVFKPSIAPSDPNFNVDDFCEELLKWSLDKGVDHASFISFPYNSVINEKQDSLLDLRYHFGKKVVANPRLLLDPSILLKGEADGSSVPNGDMRQTHRARAYNLWDSQSEIFIRERTKVLYIPSLLVTHHGEALDDKTIFRRSEAIMKTEVQNLLEACGAQVKEVTLFLGLEQEFFVIPTSAYHQRNDLRYCSRAMIGQVGAKNQQFSDHYYAKIPFKVEAVMREVEEEMLKIGIPLKAKHNEVANNQFEFACIYQEAGHTIDRNLFVMELLKEIFARYGYTVLLHEKPFREINGSGKHANYSVNYVNADGKLKNLFTVPDAKDEFDVKMFRLFVLLTLMSLKRNNPLYFATIANPGNEVRLGGHEAPPKIISAYVGQTISAILDGKERPVKKNLKESVPTISNDVFQEDTDRNRTSPYAYSGHKFEFRALGSSQNAAYPMSVIAATLAKECKIATEKIKNGQTVDQVIEELTAQTQDIRFEGDGYSKAWAEEATKRGLYVNKSFTDIYYELEQCLQVFVEVGACSKKEVHAKAEVCKEEYIKTVYMEYQAFLHLARQQIIPRAFRYLSNLRFSSTKIHINRFAEQFQIHFDNVLKQIEDLEHLNLESSDELAGACKLRTLVADCESHLNRLVRFLEKDEKFPDLEDFLRL